MPHQAFHQLLDLRLIEKGRLDVELRELGLPVGAQILVAKAAHDLVVAVEARDHQQLLVDLRRLRQREELAGMGAARHQVIARALRRRLGEHRRLDVDEAGLIQVVAHGARDPVAQQQPLAHFLAAQIEIAKAQPHLFAHRFIELKRQWFGAVENLELLAQQFDLTRLQVGIRRAGRPRAHQPRDLEHELIAHALGQGKHRGLVGVEHDLQQTLAIAQVDEDDAAMVAAAMRPAGHGDDLPRQ